ncbi:MAG TPA: zinc-ribbon domain-containing protein [Flavobacterium sp.]|uniref:zinc-ribbon domain-containing protein n=1 Tax=Flavobacterium sp. TaxID=239 RepID=UPI002C5F3437|nr:zinc-ribbon domain-containing protein [Flavobacterium sp.]HNP33323.1 zinc-ribbon domain-containing protein [Flavobacterium sp.]
MFSYGIKSKTLREGELTNLHCEYCGEDETYMEYTFSQKYFHLYFIPIFPLRKKVAVCCDDCGMEYYNDSIPKAAAKRLNQIKDRHPIRTPVWMYSGSIIIVLFFIWAFWQSGRHDVTEGEYIKEPKKGDVFYIESKPKKYSTVYTTWRIDKVDKENVYVTYNDSSVSKYTAVFGILNQRYYTTKKGIYTRKKIQELYKKDSIVSITRE